MEAVTCRYTDPNRLCYTNPGQLWCAQAENAGHPGCQDLGAEVTAANLNGPGTWAVRARFAALGVTTTPLTPAQTKNKVHEVLPCLAQTHASLTS